ARAHPRLPGRAADVGPRSDRGPAARGDRAPSHPARARGPRRQQARRLGLARHRSQDALSQAPALRRGARVMTDDPKAVPPAWPALVALGAVVLLSIATIGVDLVVDQQTAETTSKFTQNSIRSVALADDLRYQAYRLSTANLMPDQIASIAEQIDADARAYD